MVAFINTFLSYVLVAICFFAVMMVGGFLGLKVRNSKDAKAAALAAVEADTVEEEK